MRQPRRLCGSLLQPRLPLLEARDHLSEGLALLCIEGGVLQSVEEFRPEYSSASISRDESHFWQQPVSGNYYVKVHAYARQFVSNSDAFEMTVRRVMLVLFSSVRGPAQRALLPFSPFSFDDMFGRVGLVKDWRSTGTCEHERFVKSLSFSKAGLSVEPLLPSQRNDHTRDYHSF
jgi:hypothetical protein